MKERINKKKTCSGCNGSRCGEPYDCHGETYWHSCPDCHGDGFEHIKIYTPKEKAAIKREKEKEERDWQAYLNWRKSHFNRDKLLKIANKHKLNIDDDLSSDNIRLILLEKGIIPAVFGIDYP